MIGRLALTDFRSYPSLDLELGPGVTVVHGPNGTGKTNLLEALYLVSQAHSFRTRDERELIRWGASGFVVRAEGVSRGLTHQQALGISGGRRQVRINGKDSPSLSGLLGWFPAVAMVPADLELVRGAPEVRRKFLDMLLGSRSPADLDLLRRWNRILAQRNRLLRDAVDGPDPDPDLLAVLTSQFVELSAQVMRKRTELVQEIGLTAAGHYARLSGGAEVFGLQYRSSLLERIRVDGTLPSVEQVTLALSSRLADLAVAERSRGITLPGPQRDDVDLLLDGHAARIYGSQGQARSIALALKLSTAMVLESSGEPPLLLLDDVFAELDPSRREALAALLPRGGQVWIAVPRHEDLPFHPDQLLCVPGI